MIHTSTFVLLTIGATLVTLLALISLPSRLGRRLARWLFVVVGLLSLTALIVTTLRSARALSPAAMPPVVFQVLLYRAWIPLGVALAAVTCLLVSRRESGSLARTMAVGAFTSSPLVPQSIHLSIVLSLVGVELGKLTHDVDMRQFFVDSGYPFWANYVVIVAELMGVIGLFVASLRLFAGLGLTFLMLGAIGTHLRNGDPFSDSLEALQLLILLVCLLTLWRRASGEPLPGAAA